MKKIKYVFLSVFLISISIAPMIDPDLGWHLVAGNYTLSNFRPPQTDLSSFALPDYTYAFHSWLSEAILAIFHQHFGLTGVGLFYSLIASLSLFTIFTIANVKLNINTLFWLAIFSLLSLLLYSTGLRIQTFTVLGLFVLEYLMNQQLGQQNTLIFFNWIKKTPQILMIILFLVWVNLHGGFVLGYLYLGMRYLLYAIFHLEQFKDIKFCKKIKNLSIFLGILIFVSLINPYGLRLHKLTLQMITNPANSYNTDWYPIYAREEISQNTANLMLIIGCLMTMYLYRKKPEINSFIALFLILTLASNRFSLILFVFITPKLLSFFNDMYEHLKNQDKFLFVIISIVQILFIVNFVSKNLTKNFKAYSSLEGLQKASFDSIPIPLKAIEFLNKNKYEENLFNEFNWGGYLALFNPKVKYFIDGKMDNYYVNGKSFVYEYSAIVNTDPGWEEKLANYQVNTTLVEPNSKLAKELSKSKDWEIVYQDQLAVIFQKQL